MNRHRGLERHKGIERTPSIARRTGRLPARRANEPMVERTCRHCGGRFKAYASQIRQRSGGGRYCSNECRRSARASKPRICEQCGAEFTPRNPGTPGTGRFCSHRCHNDHRAAEAAAAGTPLRIELTCPVCGRRFVRIRSHRRATFCSRECQGIARRRWPNAEGEAPSYWRGAGWRKLARTVRERDGVCVRCGGTDIGRALSVDHVVPFHFFAGNVDLANDERNLASLCQSCHGVKTTAIEPRLLRGDLLAIREFYGPERMATARCLLNEVAEWEAKADAT